MSGNTSLDWDDLAAAWRAEPAREPVRDTIAARVRRHSIVMWIVTGVELGILAGVGVFAWWALREEAGAARITAVSGLVALSLGIQAFALWNRRGSWRSLADSPEAHLDLAERRAAAKLRVAVAVRVLAVAQAAAVLAFVILIRDGTGLARPWAAFLITLGLLAGYWVWSVWYARRGRAELIELRAARALLAESFEDP